MLELLFVLGFFLMLMVTGVSLLGILAALVVATAIMFLGGMFALMIKLLPWATAGGGCGVGDQSSKNAKNPTVSAQ